MDSIRPIHGARDHKVALTEIDVLLAAGKLTKAQNACLEVLTVLVSDYEDRAFPTGAWTRSIFWKRICELAAARKRIWPI